MGSLSYRKSGKQQSSAGHKAMNYLHGWPTVIKTEQDWKDITSLLDQYTDWYVSASADKSTKNQLGSLPGGTNVAAKKWGPFSRNSGTP